METIDEEKNKSEMREKIKKLGEKYEKSEIYSIKPNRTTCQI